MARQPADPPQQRRHSASPFREPGAPSLIPTLLQWEPAAPHLRALLQAAHAGSGMYYSAAGMRDGAIAYCRITDVDRDVDLFIKIMPKRLAAVLQRSAAIADYVRSSGLLTPTCLPRFPKPCSDGRVMYAYPFVEGNYLIGSRDELQALGTALAELHQALAAFPEARRIARRRSEVRSRMRRQAAELLADPQWAAGELSAVRSHLRHWLEIDAKLGQQQSQVIHNDLNAGNVLLDTRGKVWFLDFEEAAWSHLPPHFDAAKVIERFVLVNESRDRQSKMEASRLFLHAYAATHAQHPAPRGAIPDALRWLLGLSWLRMSRLLYTPNSALHPEVRKFIQLTGMLEDNLAWLATL